MDAYLTGGVDRPAAALASLPPPPPPHHPAPPPPQPPATQHEHNHQNSHQLAPQQCLGQGWEGIRRRRPCGNNSRSLSRRLGTKTSSAPRSQSYLPRRGSIAQPAVRKTLHVQPRRPCRGKEEICIYRPVPPREKKYASPHPAEGKNIYRPVPPREKDK